MNVTVKLGGRLKEYAPKGQNGIIELTTSDDIKLAELLKRVRIEEDVDELLIVTDGTNVPPSQRSAFQLSEGSVVNIMPPLKGG
ncbi:MAG: MoaD/ThiS family protein [Pseudomonadota bacterium]